MTEHWTTEQARRYFKTGERPEDRTLTPLEIQQPTASDIKAERDLQRLCELELHRRGIEYLHLSPRAREKTGWPDLTFALRREPIAVELKSERGRLRDEQVTMLKRMKANGWRVYVLRDMAVFVDLLNGEPIAEWS